MAVPVRAGVPDHLAGAKEGMRGRRGRGFLKEELMVMNGTRMAGRLAMWLVVLLGGTAAAGAREGSRWEGLRGELTAYRQELEGLRRECGGTRKLPAVDFYLFGMGARGKLVYGGGVLREAMTGRELRRWEVAEALIVPPAYTVAIRTKDGQEVWIVEDEEAVWLEEGDGPKVALTAQAPVKLPDFAGHRYGAILRVLHQELLVNVVDGRPVPNFLVYRKPWYRDGAMMAMAFERTGNLDLIEGWIGGLSEPYDRNNSGEEEADNLGQALYLISLGSERGNHRLVPVIRRELKRFERNGHIEGRSDFAVHPVYQTKWAKFGLAALGLDDPYEVPLVADDYAALFWWAYREEDMPGQTVIESDDYPYLTWAGSHYAGTRKGKVSDRDYPLTWEAKASQAAYEGMRVVDWAYVEGKLCAPHTWHTAEMFLDVLEWARE